MRWNKSANAIIDPKKNYNLVYRSYVLLSSGMRIFLCKRSCKWVTSMSHKSLTWTPGRQHRLITLLQPGHHIEDFKKQTKKIGTKHLAWCLSLSITRKWPKYVVIFFSTYYFDILELITCWDEKMVSFPKKETTLKAKASTCGSNRTLIFDAVTKNLFQQWWWRW